VRQATIIRRCLLPVLLAGVAACSSAPPAPTIDTTSALTRAETALAAGNYASAAALYRQLAATARGAQRTDYLVRAASALLEVPDFAAAGTVLEDARTSATPAQVAAIETRLARVEVGLGQPADALARLDAVGPTAEPMVASLAAEVRGRALFALGRPADAVAVLVEREIWLDTSTEILANQQLIWDGLAGAQAPLPPVADEIVNGWLALAPLTRLENDPVAFRRALLEWRERFGTHPAAGGVLADIVAAHRSALDFPQRIALLLPLGSARRIPAQAVRDGFLAARVADPEAAQTTVTIYDTSASGSVGAYVAAQADGADFIVGPLLPEEVDEIVPQAGFVPTLALNFSQHDDAVFPSSLYQYALSPEDEARAIAARAIAEGQRTAIALYASNDRGYRLVASFRDAFEALGGRILASAAYVPESQNAAGPIADILNVARSEQRHRRLEANLGRPVEFESRRRQDVDMIFLQATASLGRLLAPQLRFHKAGDIPTYATSDIYDTARTGTDSDLNGVIFPDLPILLTPDSETARLADTFREYWPQQSRQWIRLYGFGYDAYQLVRPIFSPRAEDWPLEGVTGVLELAGDGRIHRGLPFARFENGTPTAIAPAPNVVLTSTPQTEIGISSEPEPEPGVPVPIAGRTPGPAGAAAPRPRGGLLGAR
jgi:hypothetical protein